MGDLRDGWYGNDAYHKWVSELKPIGRGPGGTGEPLTPEQRRAIARTLAGDDADLGAPTSLGPMALYARWSSDGYDEAVIGAVEPVGFAATAVSVPVGGHPCAPGYSGANCGRVPCGNQAVS